MRKTILRRKEFSGEIVPAKGWGQIFTGCCSNDAVTGEKTVMVKARTLGTVALGR
jgi:hypothetical protein